MSQGVTIHVAGVFVIAPMHRSDFKKGDMDLGVNPAAAMESGSVSDRKNKGPENTEFDASMTGLGSGCTTLV